VVWLKWGVGCPLILFVCVCLCAAPACERGQQGRLLGRPLLVVEGGGGVAVDCALGLVGVLSLAVCCRWLCVGGHAAPVCTASASTRSSLCLGLWNASRFNHLPILAVCGWWPGRRSRRQLGAPAAPAAAAAARAGAWCGGCESNCREETTHIFEFREGPQRRPYLTLHFVCQILASTAVWLASQPC
jgi:hypothetical protein